MKRSRYSASAAAKIDVREQKTYQRPCRAVRVRTWGLTCFLRRVDVCRLCFFFPGVFLSCTFPEIFQKSRPVTKLTLFLDLSWPQHTDTFDAFSTQDADHARHTTKCLVVPRIVSSCSFSLTRIDLVIVFPTECESWWLDADETKSVQVECCLCKWNRS